jgi:hypothetical protein
MSVSLHGLLELVSSSFPCSDRSSFPEQGVSDEDIPIVDTTAAPTPPLVPGPITRARARQLNYQILSFLGTLSNTHENMMLPKADVFMLPRNDGPSMDKKDNQWSMMMHEDSIKVARIEDDATRADFRTFKTS